MSRLEMDASITRLAPPWSSLAQGLWLATAALTIALWALGSHQLLLGAPPDCARTPCDFVEFSAGDVEMMRGLDLPALANSRVWTAVSVLYSAFFFTLAGLVFWRKRDNWMALLVAFALTFLGALGFTTSDDALRRAYPQISLLLSLLDLVGFGSLMTLFLTFPSGRVIPRWAAGVVFALLFATQVVPLVLVSSTRLQGPRIPLLVTLLWLLLFIGMIGIGLYSQIYRFRHVSSASERQQTKWVLFGLGGAFAVVPLWTTIGIAFPPAQPSPTRVWLLLVGTPVILAFASLLPLSLTISILRYRLFEIDIVIKRTLVYGAVTASVLGLYFGSVLALQAIFRAVAGQESPLAIVASTLAIAALFNPLRRRFQTAVNRRFYRADYDAALALQGFGERVREEVDLGELEQALIGTVHDTLQPAHVSLWLRSGPGDRT